VIVRAPATSANLGPGFDCAAVALNLWNELDVYGGDNGTSRSHLGVRAFEILASADGRGFAFTDRIPPERGLGSSAAVIALGLVAAALAARRDINPEALLAEAIELDGHGDNLAAALMGGVCLTSGGRIVRIADRVPAVPLVVVPQSRVPTGAARAGLPRLVPHTDAAFTAGRAALLGAALASGSPELFAEALEDRLHEPYRIRTAPLLDAVRTRPPDGALGATLSGSGPSVIVWARAERASGCAEELRRCFPGARVLRLAVATRGAGPR
jgi:homoserine kinase